MENRELESYGSLGINFRLYPHLLWTTKTAMENFKRSKL